MRVLRYERPVVLMSCSTEELIREAAACNYESEVTPRNAVDVIHEPVERLASSKKST
jgi:hypothetical protein